MSESLKNFFGPIISQLQLSQELIIRCGVVAGVSFLIGFLLKKFSAYIAVLVALILGVIVLSHLGVINVVWDWTRAQSFLGFNVESFFQGDILEQLMTVVRMNIVATGTAIIGFLIGLRLG